MGMKYFYFQPTQHHITPTVADEAKTMHSHNAVIKTLS